jgi:hypothetical protein
MRSLSHVSLCNSKSTIIYVSHNLLFSTSAVIVIFLIYILIDILNGLYRGIDLNIYIYIILYS